ncbi:hypothetical protein [Albidovulum sp.]
MRKEIATILNQPRGRLLGDLAGLSALVFLLILGLQFANPI